MKKLVAIFAVVAMLFTFAMPTFAADNFTVDLEALGGTTRGAHGYGFDATLLLEYYGSADAKDLKIATGVNLADYSAIEITYATDPGYTAKKGSMAVPACLAITGEAVSGGIGNGESSPSGPNNADKIIASADCVDAVEVNAGGTNWDKNERVCTIDLTNVTYNGDVYLYHYNSVGNGILVSSIRFVAGEAGDAGNGDAGDAGNGGAGDAGTPGDGAGSTGDKDPADNPATGDFAVVVAAAVAAIAFAGVVVCKKVRA